jgi:acyl-CoA synthetase (AMP-forming)/AMP-acid ligase II
MAFNSPLPDVEIPESQLTDVVLRHAEELADKPALIDGMSGRSYTYGELSSAMRKLAGSLAARGYGRGDVVAILAPNLPEYAIVFHGTALVGAAVTTINPTYTVEEVAFQLEDARARMIVTVPMFLETALGAAAEAGGIEEVVVLGEADGATPFAALLDAEPFTGSADVEPGDVVVLPYSSGTTGLPKGVMLTHRNLVANLVQCESSLDFSDDEVLVAVLPFFHIYGMQVLMNAVLHNGGTAVTLPRFDLEEFLRVLQNYSVTRAYVVPPIILALAKHPLVDEFDLSDLDLIMSGAAPLSADIGAEAAARVNAEVVQGYGLTETSPVTHTCVPGQSRAGSIGFAVANTEVRVIDPESGSDLGVGAEGELWIRGPQVMKGYLHNEEATRECMTDDGWFMTGDIGRVDEDGYWYITDRLKELIKYKGFQVPPAELEGLLLKHPAVADVAVIPIPDEEAGELPKAFVVLKEGHAVEAEELMAHVAEHVAHYKQIRLLEFVDTIPKSASGKILRRVLRDKESGKA